MSIINFNVKFYRFKVMMLYILPISSHITVVDIFLILNISSDYKFKYLSYNI